MDLTPKNFAGSPSPPQTQVLPAHPTHTRSWPQHGPLAPMVLHPRVNPMHSSSYTHSWPTLCAVCCFASLYVPCVRHLFTCPQPAIPHHHRQTLPYIPNAQTHMAFPSPPYSPHSNTHITPRTTTPYPGSQPCPHAPFAQMYPLGCIFGVLGFSPCTQTPCSPLHPHVTTPPTHLQTLTAAPTHPVCTHLHPAASHIKHPESSPNVDAIKIHALCKYSQTCSPLLPDGQRQPQPSQGHQ